MANDCPWAEPGRCKAMVWKRDTYRVVRDGRRQFAMHYDPCQCERKPDASGYCWQHRPSPPPAPAAADER